MDALRLKSFVSALERTDRLILMLFYAEQLTITEIASILELSQSKVAVRLEQLQCATRQALLAPIHHKPSNDDPPTPR